MPEGILGNDKNQNIITSNIGEEKSLKDFYELFEKFKFHGTGKSKATIRNYRYNFELLLKYNPSIHVSQLTEETIVNFFTFLNTRERQVGNQKLVRMYKNSSIAVVRSSLNCFFDWLLERGYLDKNPFKNIPYPNISFTDIRAFSPKEFETICFVVNFKIQWANLLVRKRNVALVMLLAFTGVRKEELLGLQLSDIDLDSKLIKIRAETSKSKRTRIIPINLQLISYIKDYLYFRKDYSTNFFWVSGTLDKPFTEHGVKHLIRLLSKATKINCHLHRFRHTFATSYYKQTHDIVGLQRLMGHKSIKMTLSYLRSLPDEHIVEQIQKITFGEFV